jgi:hypothetical protein
MAVLKTVSRALPELAMVTASTTLAMTTPIPVVKTSGHTDALSTTTMKDRVPRSLDHSGDFSQLYGSVPVLLEMKSS